MNQQKPKGVFCLEGYWYGDHRDRTSVSPILELVHRYRGVKYLHHKCCTVEEFEYSIKRWKTKSFHSQYPILYLGFHGVSNHILIGKSKLTLPELSEILGDSCEKTVIHFGSCSTLDIDRRHIKRFMAETKTIAIMGYKEDVDWLESTAFELKIMAALQRHPFDSKGIEKIYEELHTENRKAINELGYKMIINDKFWFPRHRKTTK